jgi:NADP-dependent alcohol dehydrogenase
MGMDTKSSDYTKDYDKTIDFIVKFAEKRLERFREKQNIRLDKRNENGNIYQVKW